MSKWIRLQACLAVVAMLVLAGPVVAQDGSKKMFLAGSIEHPPVESPLYIQMEFWELSRNSRGEFSEPKLADSIIASFSPGGSRAQPFEVSLETLKEYEVRVRALDAETGDPIQSRVYRFDSPTFLEDQYDEKEVVVKDGRARLGDIPLALVSADDAKSMANFARVFEGQQGLSLVFYYNPSAL